MAMCRQDPPWQSLDMHLLGHLHRPRLPMADLILLDYGWNSSRGNNFLFEGASWPTSAGS